MLVLGGGAVSYERGTPVLQFALARNPCPGNMTPPPPVLRRRYIAALESRAEGLNALAIA